MVASIVVCMRAALPEAAVHAGCSGQRGTHAYHVLQDGPQKGVPRVERASLRNITACSKCILAPSVSALYMWRIWRTSCTRPVSNDTASLNMPLSSGDPVWKRAE